MAFLSGRDLDNFRAAVNWSLNTDLREHTVGIVAALSIRFALQDTARVSETKGVSLSNLPLVRLEPTRLLRDSEGSGGDLLPTMGSPDLDPLGGVRSIALHDKGQLSFSTTAGHR